MRLGNVPSLIYFGGDTMKHLAFSLVLLSAGLAYGADESTKEDGKPKTAIPSTWFPMVDGSMTKGEFIDLANQERLLFKYCRISDSGVELERTSKGGELLWRTQVPPLGVEHSRYRHEVNVTVSKGVIQVTSTGAKIIIAAIDLETGKQLSRDIYESR